MAFTDQEKQLILYGKQNGKSADEITTALAKMRAGIQPTPAPAPETNSVAKDVAIGAAKGAGDTIKQGGDLAASTLPGMVAGPVLSAIPQVRSFLTDITQTLKNKIQGAFGLTDEHLKADNTAQKVGKGIELGAELLTPLAAEKGAAFVTARLSRIAPDVMKLAETAPARANSAVDFVKNMVSPKNTPTKAIAQIGQGTTDTIPSVAKALQSIDTTGVKTYKDLLGRIDTAIPDFAKAVDTELLKDPKAYKLTELASTQTTKSGAKISTDYVSRALSDLSNLYKATGDDVARANIQEIISHAEQNGLTRKEVNDISRVYGQEFGSKAFSKLGDPLTSTNAQAFETTRKGLKDVARQGLGGKEAQAIDGQLSALYDTRKLVDRNAEAVAKLQQRIQERGLVEKAGYYVAKYADVLTGGTIRGFVGGVLPRGAGYKTMNALDIENALRDNLDVIEKALAEKTDNGLLEVLQKANPAFKTGASTVGRSKPRQ